MQLRELVICHRIFTKLSLIHIRKKNKKKLIPVKPTMRTDRKIREKTTPKPNQQVQHLAYRYN